MFHVTTIRSLPASAPGESPRVEVTTRKAGPFMRILAGLIGLIVVAALVVLAIIAIPVFLVAIAAIIGLVLLYGIWALIRLRFARWRASRSGINTTPGTGEGRENVRVRGLSGSDDRSPDDVNNPGDA